MKKVVYRFGIRGLVAGLLTVNALCASAQGDGDVRQNFKDICFRSFLGINDEVLEDVNRFPCDQKWIPPIELGERFGDFTNATMTVMKNGDTGKLRLAGVKFVKSFGNETDDRALLREYEHAVDLVSNLLGVKVECSGLVDPVADVGCRPDRHIGGRITSRTILELARGQLVEILATEASYVIRSGKPIQTAAALVEIRFACSPFRSPRPSGQGSESVRELTLGNDCSDLFSLKLRVKKEEAKLQELKMQNLKECINRQGGNEREPQRQQLEQIRDELRKAREARQTAGTAEAAKSENSDEGAENTVKAEKVSVAEKLGTCDFLLNKDFKKNAKYYLCLFSASWCGPCRAEMPRIAKIYAETLRDDPDIELIHFSRDQNDDRALAWAKQNDVKFPVVKPKGGNPLDLRCNGIPHLFILKADGTLVEEDHPMRIFSEEKFRELKSGNVKVKPRKSDVELKDGERMEQVDGYSWTYRVENGGATIVAAGGKRRCTVSPRPRGSMTIPSKLGGLAVTRIESEAFCECSGITSVTIPESVKEICWRAFSECGSLKSVAIPAGVKKIYSSAFSECESLMAITVSSENTQYASRDGILFDKDMKTLVCYPGGIQGAYVVPSGVTEIMGNAFSGCAGLTSVTVPDGVTRIGEFAFSKSRALTSVSLGSGLTTLGRLPFYWCSGLSSIVVSESNSRYASRDGVLFDKDMKTVICCPGGLSGEYVIPSSVATIGDGAFDSCRKITGVTIPSSVTTIGRSGFNYCEGLTSVVIPSSVTSIGGYAFCRAVKEVVISEGVRSIGAGAFCQCGEMTSVMIPSSVTIVGRHAFSGCKKLATVVMRGERPELGVQAFDKCDSLKAIHVPANAKSWAGMKEWQCIPLVFD